MLSEFYVENLALIDEARISWSNGLNVLTGETGAGKSIVLSGVGLLLGARASAGYVRSGADFCLVEGIFQGDLPLPVIEMLQSNGIDVEDTLIMSRMITVAGKSSCRINNRAVLLNLFKHIGRSLININGQMEHILLLEKSRQQELLDSYGGESLLAKREEVALLWHGWQQAEKAYSQALREESAKRDEVDYWRFQLDEITKVNPKAGEDEQLSEICERLRHAQEILRCCHDARSSLSLTESNALEKITEAVDLLHRAANYDSKLEELAARMQEAYYNLEDVASELRVYSDSVSLDSVSLEEIEERRYQIMSLCRKYGGSIAAVLEKAAENKRLIEQWENSDVYIAALQKDAALKLKAYQKAAGELTQLRQDAAFKLGKAVTEELVALQMKEAVLSVDVMPVADSASGQNEIVFMLCANPGEVSKPLAEVASGGEIARVMLALKVVLSGIDSIPTLIFDEIDSSLGGRALNSVAAKMAAVAAGTQVICVTHAAPMAVYADNHLHVSKEEKAGRTITSVKRLQGKQRIDELCRMISGDAVTETTVRQIKEMLANTGKY